MITDIIQMSLVHGIGDFMQLYARLLRVYFRSPADVNDDDTFVCGVDNGADSQRDIFSRSKQHRN